VKVSVNENRSNIFVQNQSNKQTDSFVTTSGVTPVGGDKLSTILRCFHLLDSVIHATPPYSLKTILKLLILIAKYLHSRL